MELRIKNLKFKIVVAAACLVLVAGMGLALSSCKGNGNGGRSGQATATTYYCPMHPHVQQHEPGTCPICFMDLVPMEKAGKEAGMDGGIPESLKGLASVHLSSWKQQLIGLRTAPVQKREVTRVIRTVGRFGGGGFAAAASDFAVTGEASTGGSRHVVADVYALDLPFVRRGQTAWVSPFGESSDRVKATVAAIYPYDETQSRIVRVRLNLQKPIRGGLFANVEIEAGLGTRLSIPNDAVLSTGSTHYAFVATGENHFEPQEVSMGLRGEEAWEIASGLEEGDAVVVGANFLVDADARLKAVLAGMSAGTEQHKH